MDYVENILKIAKENNYTNKQLCELLGKNPSYISGKVGNQSLKPMKLYY